MCYTQSPRVSSDDLDDVGPRDRRAYTEQV